MDFDLKDFVIGLLLLSGGVLVITAFIGGMDASYGQFGYRAESNFSDSFNKSQELYDLTQRESQALLNTSTTAGVSSTGETITGGFNLFRKTLPASIDAAQGFLSYTSQQVAGFGLQPLIAIVLAIILFILSYALVSLIFNR